MINIFPMVYFDVFRQTSRFNLRSSNQSLFHVFGVFVDSRGRGRPLINVFLRVYFDVILQTLRFNYAHQNRVRSMFLEFL